MKKLTLIIIFIGSHIIFIFLQIHKHSLFIKNSYQRQKNETVQESLLQKKQELLHNLHVLKEQSRVKQFAHENLDMDTVTLRQLKKIPS